MVVDASTNEPIKSVKVKVELDLGGSSNKKTKRKVCKSTPSGKCNFKLKQVIMPSNVDSVGVTIVDVDGGNTPYGSVSYDGKENVSVVNSAGVECKLFSDDCPVYSVMGPMA